MAVFKSDGTVMLKQPEESYIEEIYEMVNKQEVNRWILSMTPPITLEDEREWFENSNGEDNVTMTVHSDFQLAGVTSANFYDRVVTLGLTIDTPFWGEGVGRTATRLFIDFLLENYDIRKFEAAAYEPNPSNQVLKDLGFQGEGTRRGSHYYHGEYLDKNLYGMFASEWERES